MASRGLGQNEVIVSQALHEASDEAAAEELPSEVSGRPVKVFFQLSLVMSEDNVPTEENRMIFISSVFRQVLETFRCQVCELEFPSECRLSLHAKSHFLEKPFKCQSCEQAFNHEVRSKSRGSDSPVGSGCTYSLWMYSSSSLLELRHFLSVAT